MDIKKTIRVAGIAITLIISGTTSYFIVPSVHLYDKEYTLAEYDAIKPVFIDLIADRVTNEISFAQGEIWKSIVQREMRKCGGWELTDIGPGNMIDKLNEKLKSNTC